MTSARKPYRSLNQCGLGAAVALQLLSSCAHPDTGRPSFGPLTLRSQSVTGVLRYSPVPDTAEVLHPGSVQASASRSLANYHIANEEIVMDMEMADTQFGFRLGLPAALELEVGAESHAITKAGMDHFTIAFHDTFAIDQKKREAAEEGLTYLAIPAFGLNVTEDTVDDPTLSNRQNIKLKHQLFAFSGASVALAAILSIEQQNPVRQTPDRTIDSAYQAYATLPFGNLTTHISAALVVPDSRSTAGTKLNPAWTFMLVHELSHQNAFASLLQWSYAEPVVDGFGHLSDPTLEVSLGEKARFGPLSCELGIQENIAWHDHTADWSLFYGMKLSL